MIEAAKYKHPYLLRGLKVEWPHQVWAIDITYIPMRGGYMYLCAIIDLYSRYIVGWSVSNTMEADWVCTVVRDAVALHGKPGIINSDQGSQVLGSWGPRRIPGWHQTESGKDVQRVDDRALIDSPSPLQLD